MIRDLAIIVLACRRPRCMYVTLDGICRMERAVQADIYVYVDGKGDHPVPTFFQKTILDYAGDFPVKFVVFHPRLLGLLGAHMEAWRQTFARGYEWVLYVDDDLLLKRDSLTFLERVAASQPAFFYNLWNDSTNKLTKAQHDILAAKPDWQWGTKESYGFGPWGLMLNRQSFLELDDQIRAKAYMDLPWGSPPRLMRDIPNIEKINDDGIFRALAIHNKWKLVSPIQSRVAHFGVVNSNIVLLDARNSRIAHYSESGMYQADRQELEREFFTGEKEGWLANVARVFASDALKDRPYTGAVPFYFEYGDAEKKTAIRHGVAKTPALSVILFIAGNDPLRSVNLLRVLACIREQSMDDYELILVEQCYDEAERYHEAAACLSDARYIALVGDPMCWEWGRNVGARSAASTRLLFIDADTVFDQLYFQRVVDKFPEQFSLGWGEMVLLTPAGTAGFRQWPGWLNGSIPETLGKVVLPEIGTGWGGCNAFNREFYWYVGGYNENYENWGGGDSDMHFRCVAAAGGSDPSLGGRVAHLYHGIRRAPFQSKTPLLVAASKRPLQICSRLVAAVTGKTSGRSQIRYSDLELEDITGYYGNAEFHSSRSS